MSAWPDGQWAANDAGTYPHHAADKPSAYGTNLLPHRHILAEEADRGVVIAATAGESVDATAEPDLPQPMAVGFRTRFTARARQPWISRNDDPKPYVWTKTADQILESTARYCTRINDSRH